MPAFMALLTFTGWAAAGLLWGVLWPLLAERFELEAALRQLFGITFVSGIFVAAGMFFGVERIWRAELPRFFPAGDLSAARAPRLRVRPRMLAVLLIVSLLPMAVLAVAALTRAQALLQADAATSAAIIRNLIAVIAVLAVGGVVVSAGLATLVASSIAGPLRDVQRAMLQVRDGALDVRCAGGFERRDRLRRRRLQRHGRRLARARTHPRDLRPLRQPRSARRDPRRARRRGRRAA